jgi:hypothetical protein
MRRALALAVFVPVALAIAGVAGVLAPYTEPRR